MHQSMNKKNILNFLIDSHILSSTNLCAPVLVDGYYIDNVSDSYKL